MFKTVKQLRYNYNFIVLNRRFLAKERYIRENSEPNNRHDRPLKNRAGQPQSRYRIK